MRFLLQKEEKRDILKKTKNERRDHYGLAG